MNADEDFPHKTVLQDPHEIASCLATMISDFEYIESTIRLWLDKTYTPSKLQREASIIRFPSILDEFEKKVEAKLSSRDRIEACIHSDAREDWENIFFSVLPKLRREVLGALEKALYALPYPMWSNLLPESFAKQVLPPFRMGQYLSAVRRGCDALRAVIRTKTGLHDLDGADLINQAYGKDRPFVLAVWEGHSEQDVRRGYTDMLRGAMMGIRNPYYHGTEELTQAEAARLLVILGTLWARADSTITAS